MPWHVQYLTARKVAIEPSQLRSNWITNGDTSQESTQMYIFYTIWWYFIYVYLIYMSQTVLYVLHITSVLSFYIDVVLTLSILYIRHRIYQPLTSNSSFKKTINTFDSWTVLIYIINYNQRSLWPVMTYCQNNELIFVQDGERKLRL